MAKNNYLNNKDICAEIHKSKMTYIELEDEKYFYPDDYIYDILVLTNNKVCNTHYGDWHVTYDLLTKKGGAYVESVEEDITGLYRFKRNKDKFRRVNLKAKLINKVTPQEYIETVKTRKLLRMRKDDKSLIIKDIKVSELVFCYVTYSHIPADPAWAADKPKVKESSGFMKVSFSPFQHIIIEEAGPRCVGLSHFKDGVFNPDMGRISDTLGIMMMKLVNKIGSKHNFSGYTYLDEMKGEALVQLVAQGLKYDEGRQVVPNPFAFYTTVVTNVFRRYLNGEKTHRNIRDDLLEAHGSAPSMTRQLENQIKQEKEGY